MQRELILRAKAGDHEAFAAVVEEAYARLIRTASLIVRDDDAAADAVQEALVAAWLHIRAVRDPERFDAWLYRLVVRACYREVRGRRRHTVAEIRLTPLARSTAADASGPTADHDQLERGFERLTPEHRAVLVVHHYLGLGEREAAAVLNIPIGTFKSRLSRAIQALRAALDAADRVAVLTRESTT